MEVQVPCAQIFPQRVPLKVIGRGAELDPGRIADLIRDHLGPQPPADLAPHSNQRGAYTSFTFWVTLPGPGAEGPLRAAIQALAGVIMQL